MRVFIAGASGVIGARLVPLLVAAGHEVVGMTRSREEVERLRELGAEPVVCDVFDGDRLTAAMATVEPDVVMHQLTDLPDEVDQIPVFTERNNRIRTEGTRNLLTAAKSAHAGRFLAQSIAWTPPSGSEVVEEHERMVLEADGVVLRYGMFYGPGTYFERDPPDPPRIHIDAAAQRTVELLDAPSGIVVLTETVE